MNALPRSRLEWMLAAALIVIAAAAVCLMVSMLLTLFGVHRAKWVFMFSREFYATGAFFTASLGLYLLFRRSLRE